MVLINSVKVIGICTRGKVYDVEGRSECDNVHSILDIQGLFNMPMCKVSIPNPANKKALILFRIGIC